ncbi:MAG: sugar ABC transporter substrate-binding protein [Actinomycetaceae bacterium]|nr:sugar ABC transporter substrate-binding protein [Actinomycetaceae bacterium]
MRNQYKAFVASAFALTLLLTACAGGSAGQSGGASQANKMFAWVSNENDRAQWQTFVDAAKEQDPNFSLTFEGPTFNDYWTKVKTRMTQSDAPCILTTQAARAQELEGILTPLDDLIKAEGLDVSVYNKAMMDGMTLDGKIVALPYDAEPDVLYYNKKLFAEAGLKAPGTEYTTEQFLADAKALTTGDRHGVAIKPSLMDNAPGTLAFSFGGVATKDGNLAITEKPFVDGVQFSFDLVNVHKVALAPSSSDGDDIAQGAFTSGKAAMLFDGPWMYGTLAESLKDDLGVAVIPSPSGKTIGVIQGSGFGIAKSCTDKEGAFKNIMKLVSAKTIATVAKKQGTVPSIEAEMEAWAEGKPADNVEAVKTLLTNGAPLVTNNAWNQVNTSFIQYSTEGYRGSKTAEEILKSISDSSK